MHLTVPGHRFGVRLHEEQAKPQMPILRTVRAVGPIKWLENVRQYLRCNARPIVTHLELRALRPGTNADLDVAARRGELHGIGEQVVE